MTIVYSGEGVKDTSGNLLVGVQNGAVSGAVVTGGRRNLIINGAMQVAQRGTSFAGATTAYHTDRWIDVMNLGSWTISQSSDAPDGFGYSHKWDCTTANGTLAAGSELILATRLEGQDCQQLKYGSANAESLTLSFWVKSSKTGTYTVEFDQYGDRQISRTYTIDSADTWEYKTVTVPGDTGGSIDNDNSAEFQLLFWLGAGSNLTSGTLNTSAWATTTNANRVSPSNVNLADNTANDWYITGVQLEVGSVATPFEHRSYGEELALCQRYFETSFDGGVSTTNTSAANTFVWGGSATATTTSFVGIGSLRYGTPKRATPTITIYDLASPRNTGKCHRLQLGIAGINNESVTVGDNGTSGFTAYSPSGSAATGFAFAYASDAEL